MNAMRSFGMSVLGLALVLAFAGGCASPGSAKEEHDRLYQQNVEAQATLDRTRAALEAAEADRDNLSSQVTQLQGELDAAHVPGETPVGVTKGKETNSGFENIEGVDVTRSAGKITIRVPGDVLFASGKINLKASATKTLDKIAAVIKREYSQKNIRVEGYTDVDPIKHSDWDDNLELSLERAAVVDRYLAKKGVKPVRMYAAGFGDHHPRSSKALSRRVEIVVLLRPEG